MSAEAARKKIMSTRAHSEGYRIGIEGTIHERARSADKVRCAEAERRPLLEVVLK